MDDSRADFAATAAVRNVGARIHQNTSANDLTVGSLTLTIGATAATGTVRGATAAMLRVRCRVDFASVNQTPVAISETRLAGYRRAHALALAADLPARANVAAGTAVRGVNGDIDFAAIGLVAIAIGMISGTRGGFIHAAAGRASLPRCTGMTASPAIVGVA